ncbi:peptidase M41 [Pseudomonas sp. S2_C03]
MSRIMPSAVREHALQIAHHEMGHYVVARTLGFATGGVTLAVTMDLRHHGGATITLAKPIASMAVMKAHLEARMMVLFAGVMAQTLSPAGVDKTKAIAILKGALGAEQDYAKVKELQHLLRNICYPETDPGSPERIATELKTLTDGIWVRTQTVVEDQADTIIELGSLLVGGMAIVEQWGRAADTYEVVFGRDSLERLPIVQAIPLLRV